MCNNLRVFFFHWKSSNLVFPIPTINPILSKYINYYSSNPLQNNRQRRILFIDRCYFCFHLLREYIRSRREKSQRLTKLTSQTFITYVFQKYFLRINRSFVLLLDIVFFSSIRARSSSIRRLEIVRVLFFIHYSTLIIYIFLSQIFS